eukprot:SAG22_NODE_3336_length_1771_cov_98.357057_2_plen_121_part_00
MFGTASGAKQNEFPPMGQQIVEQVRIIIDVIPIQFILVNFSMILENHAVPDLDALGCRQHEHFLVDRMVIGEADHVLVDRCDPGQRNLTLTVLNEERVQKFNHVVLFKSIWLWVSIQGCP